MTTNGPFHSISTRDVWNKLDALETSVTTAITRMEAQTKKTEENTERIKALELKLYGTIAGLIAAVTILVTGILQ